MLEKKKSDILVIYPELNMSRYECDNNYSFYFKMWKQLSRSIYWKKVKGLIDRYYVFMWSKIYLAKLLSAIFHSHFKGKRRSQKLLIFNDLGKKLNDRIKVCIVIKTTNLRELILEVVPLCCEIYNLYSANSSRRDSFGPNWVAILDFV